MQQITIDLFGCQNTYEDPGETVGRSITYRQEGDRVWFDILSTLDFDVNDHVRFLRDLFDADYAEYQVIDRSATKPREVAPWLRVGRPAPEVPPSELVPATPQDTEEEPEDGGSGAGAAE